MSPQPVDDDFFADVADSQKKGFNEAALAKYPSRLQDMAKQLATYQSPATGYMLTRSPRWQAAAQAAHEYDPSFNVGQYDIRQGVRKDFTSGPTSKALQSVNMAIKHLDDLRDASKDLNNFGGVGTPLNGPVNWVEKTLGDKRVGVFETKANAVASEMVKATRGTGGAESDVQSWRKVLDPNGSPEQQNGNIDAAIDLLSGRIAAARDTYQKGMGKPPIDLQMLSPRSRQILTGMGYDPDKIEQGSKASEAKLPPAGAGVSVVSPEGVPGTIPPEKLDEALKRGFKKAS